MPAYTEPMESERRSITLDEFRMMGETGILRPDERVELIEGGIYRMTPLGERHVWLVVILGAALRRRIPANLLVIEQGAMEIADRTQVQPDIMVVGGPVSGYRRPLPTPADVLLAVEVADSSLAYDRGLKLPVYARNGVPEVWILDVAAEAIDVHLEPSAEGYRRVERIGREGRVAPSLIPAASLDLAAIFTA